VKGGEASLEPAGDLWGRDTYETDDLLTRRHSGSTAGGAAGPEAGASGEGAGRGRPPQVMCIGSAGERLVKYANIMHGKHHAAGRTGLGAVMGSKNLKAVVVRGGKTDLPIADPAAVKRLARTLTARLKDNIAARTLTEAGTMASFDIGSFIGDLPIRNWSMGAWDEGTERLGMSRYGEFLTGQATCYACPLGCSRKVTVKAYGRALEDAPGAEYETTALFGSNLLVKDLEAVLVANDTANRLGLDTISAGATIAYAYEAADAGLLDGFEGAGDLKDGWGDGERLIRLLGDIACRRGLGDFLAEGSEALAERVGSPAATELLTTVKRLEAPAHNPRAAHSWALAYATSNRGACHVGSMTFCLELMGYVVPEAGLDYDGIQQSSEGKGRMGKAAEDLGCVFGQAAILCLLGGSFYTVDDFLGALTAATGWNLTLDNVLECGARTWHLKRGINNLYGVRRSDDGVPKRLVEPHDEGGAAGSVPDVEMMLSEWYEARGLDQDGLPRREVLEGLGLERLADLLESCCRGSKAAGVRGGAD